MLPKSHRLTKSEDYQKVLEGGRVLQGKLMGLALGKFGDQEPKAGIIVSNKISKKATERNRIRRSVREAASSRIFDFPKGTLLVFLVKKSIVGAGREDILKEARKLLEHAQKEI